MRMIRLLVLIASVISIASSAAFAQKQKSAPAQPWQSSWQKFVEAHNACIKVKTCDKKRFLNKDVRWEGVVSSIDLTKETPSVVMEMSGSPLADQTGEALRPGDLFVFVLNPLKSEVAGWTTVVKGDRIRFSARTAGGLTGSVISFSSLPNRDLRMIMVNLDGGKFAAKVPEVTKSVSTAVKEPAKSVATGSGGVKKPAKVIPELTAEGYRDLLLNTADPLDAKDGFGKITDGTGSVYLNGRTIDCIMTFTYSDESAKDVAERIRVWESSRPPTALAASHAEILKWMKETDAAAKGAPKCFIPLLQASAEQYVYLRVSGGYKRLRETAANALAGIGVILPQFGQANLEQKMVKLSANPSASTSVNPSSEPMVKAAATKSPKTWQNDWDVFLKDYQECLKDTTCQPKAKFAPTTNVEWSGVLRGQVQHTAFGRQFHVEMPAGTVVDRDGRTLPVSNNLFLSPEQPVAWEALPIGQTVRFKGSLAGSPSFSYCGTVPAQFACYRVAAAPGVQLVGASRNEPSGEAPTAAGTWQTDWDAFLRDYQACLKDTTCELGTKFASGQSVEWSGVLRSRFVDKTWGPMFQVEMTPGSVVDRTGIKAPVVNDFNLVPKELSAWDALRPGQGVRFKGTVYGPPVQYRVGFTICTKPVQTACHSFTPAHGVTLVAASWPTGSESTVGNQAAPTTANPAPDLTAEAYRELIVKTADSLAAPGGFATVTQGTGSAYIEGRTISCIMTFNYDEESAKRVSDRIKVWESARIPWSLSPSHAAILKWMKQTEVAARAAPKCFVPLFQSTAEQLAFLAVSGEYEDLRKNAAAELASLGVTLPPLPKPAKK